MKGRAASAIVLGLAALVFGGARQTAEGAVPDRDVQRMTAAAPEEASARPARPRRLLVFTLCRGFKHGSIPHGAKALEIMGRKTGAYEAVVSDDVSMFRPENLRRFDAVCMNNTTGDLFKEDELKRSLLDFVKNGKGIIGIHAATDCFYNWREYGEMMGGYFSGHPWNEKVTVKLDDPDHPLCAAFGGRSFEIADEIYQFRDPYSRDALRVLLSLDVTRTNMNKGGIRRTDNDFAVSWVRSYGKGRVFYCSLGHRNDIFWNPAVLRHYLDGIQFAMGDLPAETAPVPLSPRSVDPFMGEYAGTYRSAGGRAVKAEAKVIAEGRGNYRAVLTAGALRVEIRTGPAEGGSVIDVRPSRQSGAKGLNFAYYEGTWDKLPDFDSLAPVKTGVVKGFDISPRNQDDNFAFRFTGYVNIPEEDRYTFFTKSDDGSRLYIGSKIVVDNDGLHGAQEKTGSIKLKAGLHPIAVTFFEKGGGQELSVGYAVEREQADELVLSGKAGAAEWEGKLAGESLLAAAKGPGGGRFTLEYVARKSPTEGQKPPRGAIVLLPFVKGEAPSLDEWTNRKWRALPDGSMEVRGGGTRTRRKFGDIRLHLEFMCPFEPSKRGQGRGNSGVGLAERYEVQVLDSFGLPPGSGDCGSLYGIAAPSVNASLPPLAWQTYDITFRAAGLSADGGVERLPRITVIHNGVKIHENRELQGGTGIGPREHAATGALTLQDHGHAVRYRNIWVVELKD